MKKIIFGTLAFLMTSIAQAQGTAKADPSVGPPQFYRNAQLNNGTLLPNTNYLIKINVKNLINSETIPADGYTVVIKLGTGLLFTGNLSSLSTNYSWSADGVTDPTQVILKGVLRNAVDMFYNEDLQVPVTTVNSIVAQNYLRSNILINGAIITANNFTLNDEAGSLYQISGGLLPVLFTAFKVEALADCQAKATWEVGTETNVKGYAVEHSTDGVNYRTVGYINATNLRSYSATIAAPAGGSLHFFRIKQEDKDGTFSYSAILQTAICRGIKTEWNIITYPNPLVIQDFIKIKNENGLFLKPVKVQLTTTDGKIVLSKTINAQQTSQFDLAVKGFASGVYMLTVASEDNSQKSQTFKVTILK